MPFMPILCVVYEFESREERREAAAVFEDMLSLNAPHCVVDRNDPRARRWFTETGVKKPLHHPHLFVINHREQAVYEASWPDSEQIAAAMDVRDQQIQQVVREQYQSLPILRSNHSRRDVEKLQSLKGGGGTHANFFGYTPRP